LLKQLSFVCAAAISACAAILASTPAHAQGKAPPSFSCALAKDPIETAICNDQKLAEADSLMARLFATSRVSAFGFGASNEAAVQRKWLKDRGSCRVGNGSADKACLESAYHDRNQRLAVAALFTAPDLALATLHQIDPEAAPLYEAILTYAREPVGSDWSGSPLLSKRAQIVRLIEPYLRRFASESDLSFGRDILKDEGVQSPLDALASETKFIDFVKVTSAYLDGEPMPRSMPCAAIVKNPKLLNATSAVFGSTLDNFIMYSDCGETLPALPAVEAVAHRVQQLWPDCQGTIRFAGYRDFWVLLVDGARLASASAITKFAHSGRSRRGSAFPVRRGISPQSIRAAIDELASYYRVYRKAQQNDAQVYARSAIRDIANDRQECE
jgi:uncharacterized protein